MRLASCVVVASLVALSTAARAQSAVTVTLTPDGNALATQLGLQPSDLANKIQSDVNDIYQTNNVGGFLRGFANAVSFSNRGLGVDYVSMPHDFMIGVAANVAASSPDYLTGTDKPTAGLAPNFGIMLGTNLRGFDYPRWTLFANGFYEKAATSELSGHLTSFGAHLQYRLIEPQADGGAAIALRWIGVDVTSGFEYTKWTLGAEQQIPSDLPITGSQGSADLTMTSTGTFNLAATTYTVPVDISTGLRIVELVSVYAGGGADFTTGTAKINANLTGDIKTGDGREVGMSAITVNGSNTGAPVLLRGFGGVQLNLWKLKLSVQATVSQEPAVSLNAAIRMVL